MTATTVAGTYFEKLVKHSKLPLPQLALRRKREIISPKKATAPPPPLDEDASYVNGGGEEPAVVQEEEEELPALDSYDEAQITKIQARARGKQARKSVDELRNAAEDETGLPTPPGISIESKSLPPAPERALASELMERNGSLPRKGMGSFGRSPKVMDINPNPFKADHDPDAEFTGADVGGVLVDAPPMDAEEEEELPDLSTFDEGQIAKIQARARGKAARKKVAAMKDAGASTDEIAKAEAEVVAAVEEAKVIEDELPDLATFDEGQIAKIQARARGKAARKKVAAMKDAGASEEVVAVAEAEAEAAVEEAKVLEEELPDLATFDEGQIAKIQARARGKAARKKVAAMKDAGASEEVVAVAEAEAEAAVEEAKVLEEELPDLATFDEGQIAKIQARARGKAARKKVAAMKDAGASEEVVAVAEAEAEAAVEEAKVLEEELPDLATFDEGQIAKIQARARGKAARKKVAAMKDAGASEEVVAVAEAEAEAAAAEEKVTEAVVASEEPAAEPAADPPAE